MKTKKTPFDTDRAMGAIGVIFLPVLMAMFGLAAYDSYPLYAAAEESWRAYAFLGGNAVLQLSIAALVFGCAIALSRRGTSDAGAHLAS